ncbi:MAG: hypothetical protein HRT68_06065 [Flavobacteriaceae bacterium]|nr:hypothetical protein [Flavobacteriaceae bacterium]
MKKLTFFLVSLFTTICFCQVNNTITFTSAFSTPFTVETKKHGDSLKIKLSISNRENFFNVSSPEKNTYEDEKLAQIVKKKLNRNLLEVSEIISIKKAENFLKSIHNIQENSTCDECNKIEDEDDSVLGCAFGMLAYINGNPDLLREENNKKSKNYIDFLNSINTFFSDQTLVNQLIGDYYRFFEYEFNIISKDPLIVEIYGTNFIGDQTDLKKEYNLPKSEKIYIIPRFNHGRHNMAIIDYIKSTYSEIIMIDDYFLSRDFYDIDNDNSICFYRDYISKEGNTFSCLKLSEENKNKKVYETNPLNSIQSNLIHIDQIENIIELRIDTCFEEILFIKLNKDYSLISIQYTQDSMYLDNLGDNYFPNDEFIWSVKSNTNGKVQIEFEGLLYNSDYYTNKEEFLYIKEGELTLTLN